MADISQVKLPDGTTYNLKDSYVRTNYRALSNNDFDTINVTELNAGDLIVTGAARFLNTINGSISGNAVTATKATQDESGNNIKATYAASFSISDHTITLKNKNGVSLGTVTVPDNATDNTKMPLAGGTFTGRVAYNNVVMPLSAGKVTNLAAGTTEIFKDGIAISNPATSNDVGWIRVIGTGESDTVMEIATGDDGGGTTAETIVVRQYNTSNAIAHEAKLLDPSGNTNFPKNVTATKFIGALQGNADTATSATTATNLSGFTNTTTSGTAIDSATQNGHVYVTGTSGIYSQNDGAAFVQAYSTSWVAQIYQDYRTGQIALRGKNNGTWQSWRKVWDSVNLTSKTAAASGTDLSLVTTGEKATWNAKGSGTITSVKTTAGAHTTINVTSGAANFNVPTKTSHLTNDSGFVTQDTKNTAGSTDTSSKIFLIGATSQAANPQTYSQDTAYVGTDGCLYSGGTKVLTAHQDISGKVNKSGDTMTGCLSITSANSSWAEGIRINRGNGGYCSFVMGGAANSTSGTGDNVWWLGCNPSSYSHKWFVAHNGSTQTGTYFYVDSASQQSPHFRVGGDLAVGSKTTMSKTCTLRYNDSTLSLDFIFTT